jgi:hypothetical protein
MIAEEPVSSCFMVHPGTHLNKLKKPTVTISEGNWF